MGRRGGWRGHLRKQPETTLVVFQHRHTVGVASEAEVNMSTRRDGL